MSTESKAQPASKKRLLLVHQAFVTPDQPGGTRHYELFSQIADAGWHFQVIASEVSYLAGRKTAEKSAAGWSLHPSISVQRISGSERTHKGFAWRVAGFLEFTAKSMFRAMRASNPDVIMATTPPLPQAVGAAVVAKLRRKPLLLEVRDLWPDFAVDMGVMKEGKVVAALRVIEKLLYRSAEVIVVNSPAYIGHIKAKGIPAERIAFVPNGVKVSDFDPNATGESFRKEIGATESSFVITYTGALGPANDVQSLAEMAKALKTSAPEALVVCVGSGKALPELQQRKVEDELDNLMLIGVKNKSEIPEVLAGSDACVATLSPIPMFKMTYPNKVFDYMAAGRPVILGIDGVIREVVEKAGAGICVTPGDGDGLARAAVHLAKDRTQAKALGKAGRICAEKDFDRASQARIFKDLIDAVAEGS